MIEVINMMDRVRAVALGNSPADILLKNGRVVDVLTETIYEADVAIAEGVIAGVGSYDKAEKIVDDNLNSCSSGSPSVPL